MAELDLGLINGNNWSAAHLDAIEAGINKARTFCTSATRPVGIAGRRIFETDTLRTLEHDGTGWVIMSEPTQAWTPAVAGLTVGAVPNNGTWIAGYHRSDGWCDFYAKFTAGTASAITGALTLTLPIDSFAALAWTLQLRYYDTSAGALFQGVGAVLSSSAPSLFVTDVSGTYANVVNFSSTVPALATAGNMTNDQLHVAGRYRMNTRYL